MVRAYTDFGSTPEFYEDESAIPYVEVTSKCLIRDFRFACP